jgi:serine acetyltransferase
MGEVVEPALSTLGGDWDAVVVLQPTSPLRTAADIDAAIRIYAETGASGCVYIGLGITIGSRAVIGANSVVTRDVPPNRVVGGAPARGLARSPSSSPGSPVRTEFCALHGRSQRA